MVVAVLVTQHQGEYPLPDELAHTVLDQIAFAVIDEQPSEPNEDVRLRFHFTEEQRAPIAADGSAIGFSDDRTLSQRVKFQLFLVTLGRSRAALCCLHNRLIAQPLCTRSRPFSNPLVRYSS